MTTDISGTSIAIVDGTVVAIQGNAVSSNAPSDAQVLTWVNADSKWEPKAIPIAAKASAYSSSTQTLNGTTFTKITNWTTLFDTTSSFSTANSNFVAPITGYYQCYGQFQIDNSAISAAAQIQVKLYVNGAATNNVNVFTVAAGNSAFYTCQFNNLVQANSGQTIDFRVLDNGSNSINGSTSNNFVNIIQVI